MLTVYIVATIIAGGLLLISSFFGGHDHDGDFGHHDIGHDHGHDGEHDADHGVMPWIPFLSLRFWTYAFALFGMVGWALTAFTNTPSPVVLGTSIGAGLVMGFVVALLMRLAKKMAADSSTRTQDLLGVEGKVTVPVHALSDGKVRVSVKGDVIDFLALSNDDRTIESGEHVVIVAVENNRLRVIPKSDLLQELQ